MVGKQILDASLQMDRLNKAYATITGSSSAAQNQLDYMYDVTQRLGLQFQGTAEAAKGFFAAGKDSAVKDHLNGIFESVSMAGSALALSKDQMDGVCRSRRKDVPALCRKGASVLRPFCPAHLPFCVEIHSYFKPPVYFHV